MKNQLTPEKYIKTKARELPYHETFVLPEWNESGITQVIVSKKMPGGNFIIGTYLVDLYCLGLKDSAWYFNQSSVEYKQLMDLFIERFGELETCTVEFANNLIFGAIDYAEEAEIKPHKSFSITEYILNPELIDDGIDELEFGKDGKHFFVAGPYDKTDFIIGKLNRTLGKDNFLFMVSEEQYNEMEDDDYYDEEEDDTDDENEDAFDEYEDLSEKK